jgi:Cu(I)/Ag(I) efflux system membrane fusion protein
LFEPRAVTSGRRANNMVEIVTGLKDGETVVTSATFLIDAESNLRAALQGFGAKP